MLNSFKSLNSGYYNFTEGFLVTLQKASKKFAVGHLFKSLLVCSPEWLIYKALRWVLEEVVIKKTDKAISSPGELSSEQRRGNGMSKASGGENPPGQEHCLQ